MALLGDRNWWMPTWLGPHLPHIEIGHAEHSRLPLDATPVPVRADPLTSSALQVVRWQA